MADCAPRAEVICRDRGSSYSRAATTACPDAVHVADRWHLLQSLSRAVEQVCHQHRCCLKKHAERGHDRPVQLPVLDALPPTLIVQRVLNRHVEINRMVATGYPVSEIARRRGPDRKTVRHYRDIDLDTLLASARDRRSVPLDRFSPSCRPSSPPAAPAAPSCSSAFASRATRVATPPSPAISAPYGPVPRRLPPTEIPSPRRITGWIMRARENLSPRSTDGLDEVRLACPDITSACDFDRAFTDLLRHRRGALLEDWIRRAERTAPPPVKRFAGFPRQDIDAVLAGLTLDYSSGRVEGHVSRWPRTHWGPNPCTFCRPDSELGIDVD